MFHYSLRQLEYLVACIEQGSVAAAAHKLNVSQPSVSAAIAKLEESFGLQLLLRHHARGVTPTAAAERLLQSARSLLSHARDLERTARTSGDALAGELQLGGFITLAPMYLPGLMAALKNSHPGLHLRIEEGTQGQLIDGLRNGRYETALLYDLNLPSDLRVVNLVELSPYVLMPQDHPLSHSQSVRPEDLATEPLILLDVQPSREYFTGLLRAAGVAPNIAHTSPSLELVRGLVGQGLGISILVTRPTGDMTYDGKALVTKPLAGPVETSRIVLATLKDFRPTRIMTAFETLAKAHFSRFA